VLFRRIQLRRYPGHLFLVQRDCRLHLHRGIWRKHRCHNELVPPIERVRADVRLRRGRLAIVRQHHHGNLGLVRRTQRVQQSRVQRGKHRGNLELVRRIQRVPIRRVQRGIHWRYTGRVQCFERLLERRSDSFGDGELLLCGQWLLGRHGIDTSGAMRESTRHELDNGSVTRT